MEQRNQWFALLCPRMDELEGFYNIPGRDVRVRRTYHLEYVPQTPQESLEADLRAALDDIIAQHGGIEAVRQIVGDSMITGMRMRGDGSGDSLDPSIRFDSLNESKYL